eukprot:333260_1
MWPPPLMNLCLENFRNKTQTTSCHPTLHLTKSNPNTKNNMNRLLAVFIVLIMCGFVTGTTGTTATNEFNPNYQLFPQGTVNGFYEAENYCQTLGGHLASIHDATTNDLVSDLLRQNGAIGYGWIGFNKITNSWTDNSLVDYTADFIPSVHDECTAIAIYDESNKWTQVPCTNPYAFACYIPPSKSSTCNHYWEYPVDICLYGDENNRKSSIFRCIDENTIEEKVYNGLTCNESNLITTDTFECTPEMDCYCALNGIPCQGFVGINTWCDSGSQSNFFGIVDTCQRNFEGGSNINYCNENGQLTTKYWLSDVNCDPLAPYTQDIYHTSCPNATRAVTCNLLQRNEQFTTENPLQFSHIGCFKDSESRALDDVDYGYGHSISECAQKCINYNYFSLQHDSYCFCENNMDDATRYGISDACINGLGGVWANDLYKQGITFNIVAWNEFHATVGYEGNFFGAYHSDVEKSGILNDHDIYIEGKRFIVNYFAQSAGQPETGARIDYIYVYDTFGNQANFKNIFGGNGVTTSMIWSKNKVGYKSCKYYGGYPADTCSGYLSADDLSYGYYCVDGDSTKIEEKWFYGNGCDENKFKESFITDCPLTDGCNCNTNNVCQTVDQTTTWCGTNNSDTEKTVIGECIIQFEHLSSITLCENGVLVNKWYKNSNACSGEFLKTTYDNTCQDGGEIGYTITGC